MGIKQTGRYLGNKKIETIHEPSGARIITAAPVDNQGDGSSFSPTDLAATSLASCMLTIMSNYADPRGIDLSGSWFEVEKIMASEGPRRIGTLRVDFHLPVHLPAEERVALERAAAACPVKRSLDEAVQVETTFGYDVARA